MENKDLRVHFDRHCGAIDRLSVIGDPYEMNFIKADARLGQVFISLLDGKSWQFVSVPLDPITFEMNGNIVVARFERDGLTLTATYSLEQTFLRARYMLTNNNKFPYYFKDGDVRLSVPFNDGFTDSEVCQKYCCHQHIWAGLESSYIFAERMGVSNDHIGMFFEKGIFSGYTQLLENRAYGDGAYRGDLLFNLAPFHLLSGESYIFSFSLFKSTSRQNFFDTLKTFDNYLHVRTDTFTVQKGQEIRMIVDAKNDIESAQCFFENRELSYSICGKTLEVRCPADTCGEHHVRFIVNGTESYADFNVLPPLETLIEKRIRFIVEKQQCSDARSPLYGAYLPYDLEESRQYFHYLFPDHNACRERFGMASLIAKWLQTHYDEAIDKSLALFTDFLFRECVDRKTGAVSNTILHDSERMRFYNVPWVVNILYELYKLHKDTSYLDILIRVMRFYYTAESGKGKRFYPDGCLFADGLTAIESAGKRSQAADVFDAFFEHIANLMANGRNYPPHEVSYEQTIVSPAATLMLDAYRLTSDPVYLRQAELHLSVLQRFDGMQPDFHLNRVAIRYWDDFWFGKSHIYADTMPHYWSAFSGLAFAYYGHLACNAEAVRYGLCCVENCAALFDENGRGHAAYIYPTVVNDRKGKFFDAFANDQDLGLYFLLKTIDIAK